MSNPQTDPLEQLLGDAFERSLDGLARPELVAAVMTRIQRRLRQRLLVFAVVGLLATAVCISSALPLIGLLVESLSGIALPAWDPGLPALLVALGILLGGGWLMVEEPV